MKSVVLEHSEVFFHESGIVEIQFQNGVDIELSEVQKLEEVILSNIDESEAILMLAIPGEGSSLGKGIMEFSKKHSVIKRRIAAQAVVVNNLAQKLLLNFFLKYSKRNMKLFDDREKALQWLKKQKA